MTRITATSTSTAEMMDHKEHHEHTFKVEWAKDECCMKHLLNTSIHTLPTVADSCYAAASECCEKEKAKTEATNCRYEQRSIRFNLNLNEKYEIESRSSYTEKETMRCWYSRDENKKIKSSLAKAVQRFEAGKPEVKNMSYRGIHDQTTIGEKKLDQIMDLITNSVKNEQSRQWATNMSNESKIARISQQVSAISLLEARQRAQQDEEEATAIHFDELDDYDKDNKTLEGGKQQLIRPSFPKKSNEATHEKTSPRSKGGKKQQTSSAPATPQGERLQNSGDASTQIMNRLLSPQLKNRLMRYVPMKA